MPYNSESAAGDLFFELWSNIWRIAGDRSCPQHDRAFTRGWSRMCGSVTRGWSQVFTVCPHTHKTMHPRKFHAEERRNDTGHASRRHNHGRQLLSARQVYLPEQPLVGLRQRASQPAHFVRGAASRVTIATEHAKGSSVHPHGGRRAKVRWSNRVLSSQSSVCCACTRSEHGARARARAPGRLAVIPGSIGTSVSQRKRCRRDPKSTMHLVHSYCSRRAAELSIQRGAQWRQCSGHRESLAAAPIALSIPRAYWRQASRSRARPMHAYRSFTESDMTSCSAPRSHSG